MRSSGDLVGRPREPPPPALTPMLAKYGSIQLLARFLPGLIGFMVAAALTRMLPPEQYGTYGLVLALSQFAALGIFGWIGLSITRFATGQSVDSRFVNSILAVFVVPATLAILTAGFAFLLPLAPGLAAVAAAAATGSLVFAYFDVNASFLTARLDFGRLLALNVGRAAIGAALMFAAAYYIRDGLAVFAVSLGATVTVCLAFPRALRISLRGGIDRKLVARLVRFGMPIAASLCLFALCGWSDRVILSATAGISAVGFYTAATVVVQNSLQMAAQAIGSAAYPLAVLAYDSGNRLASDRQLGQNFVVLIGVLVPAAVGLSVLSPNIVSVLVGPSYRDAVIRLTPLLAFAAVVSGVRGNFVDHAFHLTRSTSHYFWISAGMAPVNLVALVLLIPRFGYMGAGTAVAMTELVGLAHALLAARCVYPMPFPLRDTAKVVAAVLAMAVALVPFAHLSGPAALSGQISLGLTVYALALWCLNLLNLRRAMTSTLLRWLSAL
jgi:O-antigen/teichoic acid export membrane protein